jgi:hypothetical protein
LKSVKKRPKVQKPKIDSERALVYVDKQVRKEL